MNSKPHQLTLAGASTWAVVAARHSAASARGAARADAAQAAALEFQERWVTVEFRQVTNLLQPSPMVAFQCRFACSGEGGQTQSGRLRISAPTLADVQ